MNYVGHALVAAESYPMASDAFIFGSMAPDLVGMAGTKLVRGCRHEDLASGVEMHIATDQVFNRNPRFSAIKTSFLPAHLEYLPRGAARACADPGTEMLLDGFVLQKAEAVQLYERLMRSASLSEYPVGQVALDGQALTALVERCSEFGAPYFYQDPEIVAERLWKRLSNRPRLRFDRPLIPKVAETFQAQQIAVSAEANGLIEETIASFTDTNKVDVGPMASILPKLAVTASKIGEDRSKYGAGRRAGRLALKQLGYAGKGLIRQGSRGEPLFPAGYVGSISHTDNWAISAVATTDSYLSVGIDIELADRQFKRDVSERVASSTELQQFQEYGWQAPLVISSIKEAVYKAIHPFARRRVGFHEVELSRSSANEQEVVAVSEKLIEELGGSSVRAVMLIDDKWLTSVSLVN